MANAIIIRQKQISRRAFVTATLCFSGVMATGCLAKPQATRPKILFVCQAGTAKSAIAREIFKKRAKERGIDVDVFSRGIVVEDHISPELRKKLIADGINTNAEAATSLKPADWATAEILVNFNPLPASVKHKDVRDWTDVPSVNDDYAKARALMNERIDALLSDIAGSAK
jgi:protein-tyrosine-phosphatase